MVDLIINKDAFNAFQQRLSDAVTKELNKAATEAILGTAKDTATARENWGISPLSSIFSNLGFSAAVSQTEMGSRIIAEYAHYEYERATEARRNHWVVDWDYSRNRVYYLHWYSYRAAPSKSVHIRLRDELDRRQWEVTIDDLIQIESAFREFQRYLVRDNILEYEQASHFIEHTLTKLRVWGIDALEYQTQQFNRDIHSSFNYRQPCTCPDCLRGNETRIDLEVQKANEKAKELLLLCLDSKQKAEFLENESFTVKVKSGKRYKISKGIFANVKSGQNFYCIEPKQNVPIYDKMLVQKCLLETDEKEFLRIANRS